MEQWRARLGVALRDESADLLLENASVINVFTCEIQRGERCYLRRGDRWCW